MKRFFITGIACLSLLAAGAVELDYSNNGKIATGIKMGASFIPSLDVEIDICYRPFRYIGANVGVMLITPINRSGDIVKEFTINENLSKKVNNYKDATRQTLFKAGLQFTTPALMLTEGEMGLSLRLSPGIIIPFTKNCSVRMINSEKVLIEFADEEYSYTDISEEFIDNSGAKLCSWYTTADLVLEFEEQWEFSLGYTYSNFDLYGGSRNIEINGTKLVIADKKPMHSIMIGLSYKF